MNLVDMVNSYKTQLYPFIPYRTGRLATTSMGDMYSPLGARSYGFDFCRSAGIQYGIILNEVPVLHYNIGDRQGSYVNRHYGYFDRFFDQFAMQQAMLLGGQLIEGEVK